MKSLWADPEYRKRMSDAHKGNQGYWTGKKLSEEHRKKLSESHKGQVNKNKGKKITNFIIKESNFKKGRIPWNKGIKMSKESRIKSSISHKKNARKGKDHHNWKGGLTTINQKIRNSLEYRLWRDAVFERDKWICGWCGIVGGKLHADHIKPFALFPELRFSIDNGRTLCIPCHKKTDTYLVKTRWINKKHGNINNN